MDIISYSDARARLRGNVAKAPDHGPTSAAPQEAEAIMATAIADWTPIQETRHLLSNPANLERLRAAIAELDHGRTLPTTFPLPLGRGPG